jgi:NodT family efflux transporter outer membrane factor (OMF) lipoprotein
MRSPSPAAIAMLALAGLTGCTVGPDYHGPPTGIAPVAEGAAAFRRAGDVPVSAEAPAARWWTALGDPDLDALITAALADSPTVQVAEARLRAALRATRRGHLPSASANAVYLRSNGGSLTGAVAGGEDVDGSDDGAGNGSGNANGNGDDSGGTFQLYNVGFDSVWELDLFGGKRRESESARAQAESLQASLADVQVSLSAEVAQAYIRVRDLQQRLRLARQSSEMQERILALTQQRRSAGTASDLDVERQRTQLESTRSTTVPLAGGVTEALDQLALLTGREPGALDAQLGTPKPLPVLPAVVPVADPGAMLRRRPDIRAAERTLAARNATIGQRTADLFPKVTLAGVLGSGGTDFSDLLSGGSFTYILAPFLQWNFFNFGATEARIDQARANRDEAAAEYRRTVLTALNDAETALSRFGHQRQTLVSLARTKAAAERSAALVQQRRAAQAASEIDALDAERTRLSAEQNLAAAQADLLTDFVALQKSLGLGWQER